MSTAVKVAATPKTVRWGYFDASLAPIATVPSGGEVIIETVTGEPPHVPKDPKFEILPDHLPILNEVEHGPGPHLLTGPICVEGAMPGDVLALDILDIQLRQNWVSRSSCRFSARCRKISPIPRWFISCSTNRPGQDACHGVAISS